MHPTWKEPFGYVTKRKKRFRKGRKGIDEDTMIGYKGRKQRDEKRTGEVMREEKKVPQLDEMLLH